MRRKQAGDAGGRARPRAALLVLRMRCAGASMGRATAPGARIAPAEDGRHAACTKPRRGTSHAAPARVMPGGNPPEAPRPPAARVRAQSHRCVPATPATGTRRAPGSSRTEAPVDAPAALSEHGRGSSSVGAPACHSRTPPRPGGPTCALAPRPGWRAGTAARPGPALRQVAAPPHAIHRRIASTMAKGGAARTSRRHSPRAAHDGPTAGDTPAGRSCHLGCHHGRRQRPACHPRPPRSQHRSASPPRREAAAARAAGV